MEGLRWGWRWGVEEGPQVDLMEVHLGRVIVFEDSCFTGAFHGERLVHR